MKEIKDKGKLINKINAMIADIIANVFSQRLNYIIRYYSHRHKLPNLRNPKNLSEIVLSSMLSKNFLKYAEYADKVKVRNYVKTKGLEKILLNQYGSWKNANDIPFDELPDKYILKANNGCGGHIICTDKSLINRNFAITKLNLSLKSANRLRNTEPHYYAIEPLILCEELLGDGTSLPVDYKFFCSRGKVFMIFIVIERDRGSKYCTLDCNWEPMNLVCKEKATINIPEKPTNLKEMLEVAKKLSEDFDFVRVDLYDINNVIYFGELTFSPEGGIMSYFTESAIKYLGSKVQNN